MCFISFQKLGFASCKRNSGATEGINVLFEKNLDGKWAYGYSCIEYTEFKKFGIIVAHHSPKRYFRTFVMSMPYLQRCILIILYFLVVHILIHVFIKLPSCGNLNDL